MPPPAPLPLALPWYLSLAGHAHQPACRPVCGLQGREVRAGGLGPKRPKGWGVPRCKAFGSFSLQNVGTFSSFALAHIRSTRPHRSQAVARQLAGCCGGRGAMMPLPPLLAGPQPMATRFKLLLCATRLFASLMQATTTGAPPQNTALPPPTPPTPRQQQRHCPCLTWGCQPACPCACPCPCADQSLCDPLSSAEPKARREVFAYHAHLYNETGDAGHPRESSSGAAVCLSLAATICEEDDALAIADATPTCAPAPPTPPLPLPFQP
jgi:hypothetical protein